MNRFGACVLAVFLLFSGISSWADVENEEKEGESFWMRHKLELAQDILTYLALADFGAVQDSAVRMRTLSTLEGWARRANAKEYRRELRMFEQANEQLIRQCKEENLDGATLAFTQITLSCVSCHKHLRDTEQRESSPTE